MTLPASPQLRNTQARRKAIADAEAYVSSHIWKLEDDAVAELYTVMRAAYDQLSFQLSQIAQRYGPGETWSATDAYFERRMSEIMAQVEGELNNLSGRAAQMTLDRALTSYQAGYFGRAWVMDTGLRGAGAAKFQYLLPTDAIRAQILTPYVGNTFLARFQDVRDDFVKAIRRSLIDSQIRGESIYQAQQRLADVLGVSIKRTGPTAAEGRGMFNRLEMIARTEILRSSNLGSQAVYEQNKDVVTGWEWIATKDERTCPLCGPLDGRVFDLDSKEPKPPLHPRCRCSSLPVMADAEMSERIAGKRESYEQWAAARGAVGRDGGVMAGRGAKPPGGR